jgi:Reverse transcriptase (RNA-dependent DNA polymerase)
LRKGHMPDISPYLQFTFYEEVYYLDTDERFPHSKEVKGWWVGVAHHVGDHMCFEVYTEKERVIERSVLRPVFTNPNKLKDNIAREMSHSPNEAIRTDIPASTEPITFDDLNDPSPHINISSNSDDNEVHDPLSMEAYNTDEVPDETFSPPSDIGSLCSKNEATQYFQLNDMSMAMHNIDAIHNDDTSFDKTDPIVSDNKDALIKEGLKPALIDPPIRYTRSGRNVKKPGRYVINNTQQQPSKWKEAMIESTSPTMKMFPIIANIPENGPSSLWPHIIRTTRTRLDTDSIHPDAHENRNPVEDGIKIRKYLELLRQDVRDPTEPYIDETVPINYDQLTYNQQCDATTDDDDLIWTPLAIDRHVIRRGGNGKIKALVHVIWRDGSSSWQLMDALKFQSPYVIVQYVLRNNILRKHKWFKWTSYYIDDEAHMNTILSIFKATTEHHNKTKRFKFGTEVPRSIRHALELDIINGNDGWKEAINKELKQINDYKTFRKVTKDDKLSEYLRIPYHFVFDVKFDGRKKARLVAGGNVTEAPKDDIYSGVVGIEMVRIGFLLAKLNGLTVCTADISNAFLYGTTREKVYIEAGKEFGETAGEKLIIDKGLYGLKSSSARFHEHLSAKCKRMGFLPTKADSDFWMKDCGTHYEYMARYVDDLLIFSKDPMKLMDELKEDYELKSVGIPEYFLGGDIEELDQAWHKDDIYTAISAKTYATNIVEKFELLFKEDFRKQKTPMHEEYHPEVDDTELLSENEVSVYRGLIGSANWLITLGRFDIAYAVSSLARYSAAPRKGHLEAMKRVFGYIKDHKQGRILIDASKHIIPVEETSPDNDWIEFYPEAQEELPPSFPTPKGSPIQITVYKDADHAFDLVTRRSVTGILLYLNNTPISWLSKRQKTVETSTYGSELVAARMATELIMQFRYMMRMLGVPIEGPATLCGDNRAVMINTTIPSSQLKKKHNAIAYHRVREAIAAKIMVFVKIRTEDNPADILTKPLKNPNFQPIIAHCLFRKVNWIAPKSEAPHPIMPEDSAK